MAEKGRWGDVDGGQKGLDSRVLLWGNFDIPPTKEEKKHQSKGSRKPLTSDLDTAQIIEAKEQIAIIRATCEACSDDSTCRKKMIDLLDEHSDFSVKPCRKLIDLLHSK